jgi:hypothetical protein
MIAANASMLLVELIVRAELAAAERPAAGAGTEKRG